MKKVFGWLICAVLLVFLVVGLDECGDEVTAGVSCRVTTPRISCGTYDLYNDSDTLISDDRPMSQIGSTGIYNFTFSNSSLGRYLFHLCSNDTGTINVVSKSNDLQINYIENNVTRILSDIASVLVNQTTIYEWLTTDANIVQDAELAQNTSVIKSDLNVLIVGMSTNTTWLSNNLNASSISLDLAQDLWNFNITSYNVSADFDSAGAYVRAIEVFGYA